MARPKKRSRPVSKHARRQAVERAMETVGSIIDDLWDPSVPAADAIAGLRRVYGDEPFPAALSESGSLPGRGQRLEELAAAALEAAPGSVQAALLAADAALVWGDPERAITHLAAVYPPTGHLRVGIRLVAAEVEAGRLGSALERAEDLATRMVHNADVQVMWGRALAVAHGRRHEGGPCPCGSGSELADCCRPRMVDVLNRFTDRSPLRRLEHALHRYWSRPVLEWVRQRAAEDWGLDRWPKRVDHGDLPLGIELAEPRSWLISPDLGDHPEDDPDADADCPLGWFIDDPSIPGELARLAGNWLEEARYGLWLVTDPTPDPGVMLVDIVSGARVYADGAPEQMEAVAPWSVLVGPVIPLEGIWRLGSTLVAAPDEGDRLSATVRYMTEVIAAEVSGSPRPAPDDPRNPGPLGVWMLVENSPEPRFAGLTSKVTAIGLPGLAADLERWRDTPPAIVNMDREPIVLHTARLRIDEHALYRLAELHPDFEWGDEEVVWWGRHLTEDEVRQQMAIVRQKAAEEGWELDPDDLDEPKRWLRGRLTPKGRRWVVEVNSTERFAALQGLLAGEAVEFEVESVERPELPAMPTGPLLPRGEPALEAAWAETWPDVHVPALKGLTPREAAEDPDLRARLETMLRRFEWNAFHHRRASGSGADVAAVRAELGMPAHRWW